jgi:hypothetical protein
MNDVQRIIIVTVITFMAMYGIVCMVGGSWSPTQWSTSGNITAIIISSIVFKNILDNDYRQEDE